MGRSFRSTPTLVTRTNWFTRTLSTREGPPCSRTRSQGETHPFVWPEWTSRTRAGTCVTPAIHQTRYTSTWPWEVSSSSVFIGCHPMNNYKRCIEQTLALWVCCFNVVPYCPDPAPVAGVDLRLVNNTVTCNSGAIYPRPQLTWSVSNHPATVLQNTTEVHEDDQGLYDISGSLRTVYNDTESIYSCLVQNEHSARKATMRLHRKSLKIRMKTGQN